MVALFFGTKIGEDHKKKRVLLQNEWVFGPKVCEDQKKGLRPKISGFSVQRRMVAKQSEKRKIFTTNRWSYGFTS